MQCSAPVYCLKNNPSSKITRIYRNLMSTNGQNSLIQPLRLLNLPYNFNTLVSIESILLVIPSIQFCRLGVL